ncbi:hypothetical protein [Lacinutrix sp. Bg11-31]|uniref:hypothetical protein n=1 Tax=Lacinutrix sp. Bg11-31 TaxID=2057808 RepID=UPI000C315F6E|nr:hypothetical protein [Lacinutrix sp. Bg11-31]AUC83453.1 hypothetical protein CW733_15465 [Lacinutrix sp. Bg11-31]
MAPIKYEEDIKSRLDKRTIKPSAKSWDTLSQRLDNEEKKNNKKGFWWLGIAASVIGVLLVSNFFLNIKTTNNINTIIVEENTTIDTLKTEIKNKKSNYKTKEVIVDSEEILKAKNTTKSAIKTKSYLAENTNTKKVNTNKIEAPNIQIVKTLVLKENTIKNKQSLVSIENATQKTQTKKQNVIDSEIDNLLAQATEDIAKEKSKSATIPIDYNGLLIAVEDDLDETFRDKMLKVVKKGYETVRESVAERND